MARTKKAYHHGNLREGLLTAARQLIKSGGLDALTLRAAARQAGVSHNAPYRHFADKDALIAAVAESGFAALHSRMVSQMASQSAAPVLSLSACGQAYLEFALEDADRYRLMFGPQLRKEEHPGVQGFALSAFQCLLIAVTRCMEAGAIETGEPPMDIALFLWAQVHGLAMLAIDGQLGSTERANYRHALEMARNMALKGLLTAEAWEESRP